MLNLIYRSNDRRRLVRQFGESLQSMPYLGLGFGLYWMMTVLLIYSPFIFEAETTARFSAPLPVGIVIAIVSVLVYFASARLFRMFASFDASKPAPFIVAAALVCGSLMFTASMALGISPDFRLFLYLGGLMLLGAGTAVVCLEFSRVFAFVGARCVLVHGTIALLGGSVGAFAIALLPSMASGAALVVTPIPMTVALFSSIARCPKARLFSQGVSSPVHIPYRFLVTSAIQGFALGVMHSALSGLTAESASLATLGFCIAAVLLMITALIVMQDFNTLFYRVGFPMMGAGFFIVGTFPDLLLCGSAFLDAGYCYQYLISCCLCAHLAKSLDQSPIWIVGLSTGCLLAGQIVGSAFGYAIGDAALASSLLGFFIVAAALYLFSNNNIASGWGAIRPGDTEALSDSLEQACRLLAEEGGISKRELDVMELLAKGCTRKEISESLSLSEETIKTHAGRIYQKLSIHSKRELAAAVEQRARTLDA